MREFLKQEIERCKTAMAQNDPSGDGYRNAFSSLRELQYMLAFEVESTNPHACSCRCNDANSPAPDIEEEKPAPAHVEAKTEAPKPDAPTMKKEDVRAALADARLKGVDVSKLITDLGASNLSGVDPSDYPALMAALNAALEGK